MQSLIFSASTNKGLHRDNNEDSFLSLPERGLWVVADGMGGHEAGEVASAIVRETLEQTDSETRLAASLQRSHKAVVEAANAGIGAKGMGSTVVALKSRHHDYQVAWVGDSRAYLWSQNDNGGQLEQLSTDHSYVQMLAASGAIEASELENHPDKNIITQCIGWQELDEVTVDTVEGVWQKNQWIVLCSDGLNDEVDDAEIARLLNCAKKTKDAVELLINAALENGGHDNITIQVIESPLYKRRVSLKLTQWIAKKIAYGGINTVFYSAVAIGLSLTAYWLLASGF